MQATTAPATSPATQGDAQAGHRALQPGQARRAANSLVLVTAVGLIAVLAALVVWVLHWGRRLRQQDRWDGEPANGGQEPDPWVVSGQRLEEKPGDKEQPPSDEEAT
ncbi:MAG: hypothetical protein PHU85_16935 [Phycisphaerae bacterium]|nr:hypothetical protein [Phycisphaerae bacterium]